MAIYDPNRPRFSIDAEHLLYIMVSNSVPAGVNVMFSPEAEQLDWMTLPSENYPIVVITPIGNTDIAENATPEDGSSVDVAITTLDCNRVDEPSANSNASTLADIVLESLYKMARTQRGAPGVGKIHSVTKTQGPDRAFTWVAGDGSRAQYDTRYVIGMRPSNKTPIQA